MIGTPAAVRVWQPNLRLLLFSGLMLPLLLGLGIWQLDRAGEKTRQLELWRRQAEQLDWSVLWQQQPQSGQPVVLSGRYGDHSWLLDNRTRDGVAGYEVLTLFHPEAGPPVVVNRGWVRAPARRQSLPVFPTPRGELRVAGRVADFPQPPVLAQTPVGQQSGWPRRVQALAPADVADLAPGVADRIVRLESPLQPGAFRADWVPDRMGPQTHYGYATQWFVMAAVLVVLTVLASYRRPPAGDQKSAIDSRSVPVSKKGTSDNNEGSQQ